MSRSGAGMHTLPSPVKPGLHMHVNVPGPVFVQVACTSQGFCKQALMGVQVRPLPMYPWLHTHAVLLTQVAWTSQAGMHAARPVLAAPHRTIETAISMQSKRIFHLLCKRLLFPRNG